MSILDAIPNMDKDKLEKLRANALARLDERPEARAIVDACDEALLKFQPKKFHQDRAEELMEDIAVANGWLKFRDNRIKDGVGAGGLMRSGTVVADFYVGFKPPGAKRAAYFSVIIEQRGSDPAFWIYQLDSPSDESGERQPDLMTDDRASAVEFFEAIVGKNKNEGGAA